MRKGRRAAVVAAQLAIFAVVIWFAGRTLAGQWGAVRAAGHNVHLRWTFLVGSCLAVLAAYAVLIQSWRLLLGAWGARLPFGDAARIWSVSNLGRYIPGKVWQIGAMGAMAQRRGVSPIAAAGSALVSTVVTTIAGFAVAAVAGARLLALSPIALVVIAAFVLGLLLAPPMLRFAWRLLARLTGRQLEIPSLRPRLLWLIALLAALAWCLFGTGFELLAFGLLGGIPTSPALYIATYAGSYVLGYIVLIVPAGVGVREGAMQAALANAGLDPGATLILVVVSRLWITLLEIAPALLFLAHGALRGSSPAPPARAGE